MLAGDLGEIYIGNDLPLDRPESRDAAKTDRLTDELDYSNYVGNPVAGGLAHYVNANKLLS